MHAPSVLVGSHACSSCSALDVDRWLVSSRLSLLSILQMKCTDVSCCDFKTALQTTSLHNADSSLALQMACLQMACQCSQQLFCIGSGYG